MVFLSSIVSECSYCGFLTVSECSYCDFLGCNALQSSINVYQSFRGTYCLHFQDIVMQVEGAGSCDPGVH